MTLRTFEYGERRRVRPLSPCHPDAISHPARLTHDVCRQPRARVELDEGHLVGRLQLRYDLKPHGGRGINRPGSGGVDPVKGSPVAAETEPARVELVVPTARAALDDQAPP